MFVKIFCNLYKIDVIYRVITAQTAFLRIIQVARPTLHGEKLKTIDVGLRPSVIKKINKRKPKSVSLAAEVRDLVERAVEGIAPDFSAVELLAVKKAAEESGIDDPVEYTRQLLLCSVIDSELRGRLLLKLPEAEAYFEGLEEEEENDEVVAA